MDHRLIALETKWDAIIPTLATKADLAALRTEVHDMAASQKTWCIATVITLLSFQAGIFAWSGRAPSIPNASTARAYGGVLVPNRLALADTASLREAGSAAEVAPD